MIKVSANKLNFICILFFPISTILQGISIFNSINKVLIAIIISMLIFSFFVDQITIQTLVILIGTVPLSYLAIIYMGEKAYNFNTIIYLPFWIIYFLYMKNNYKKIMTLLNENITLLKINLACWNILVLISLFVPSCYGENWGSVFFQSFSSGEHRFASSCLFAFTLFWILEQLTKEKKYYIYGILPLLGFLLCGARTYLGGAVLFVMTIYYILCKNKKTFYLSFIPVIISIIVIVLISPIGEKIITSLQGNGYFGYWATVTSGRTVFWVIDIKAFFDLNWWHRLVGNGLNYVYKVNKESGHGSIWAHNDIINLLLSNGYLGVLLYLVTFLGFTRPLLKKEYKIPKMLIFGFYSIWLFNAMFNMVYTYTCTVLATPFILYSLCHLPQKTNIIESNINSQ